MEIAPPAIELVARKAPPVRKLRELKPIAAPVRSANKRRNIFDMGQNLVGHVRLRIRNAKPGQTIDLRYTEMLDKDGKPYTTALRTARATDHYTTRGGDEEFFEPRFTFHGFRYVEVRDYPGGAPTPDDLTGIVIHSDTAPTGEFECSDPMINQLQSNIVWSQRGNFIDFPTDCPQRDERLGWTGDAQVFIRTAAYNMDVANFFHKWLQDMADTQALHGDGRIHSVIPGVKSIHHEGGPAWADAAVICPWTIYLCYGDTRILSDRWHMMSWFMDFLAQTSPDHVRADETKKWRGYGDWLSNDAYTPQDLIGVAYYAYCAQLMTQIARVLDRNDDAAKYSKLSADIRDTFHQRYLNSDGSLKVKTQTAHVLALHFDLLEERHRPAAVDELVKDIESRGMHLSTGFVGTPYLNLALTRFGRVDVAYKLLMQETFPSWLFPITHGATTMWERWDGWTPEKGFNDAGMNSYNHYAYGAVGEWMYASIAGIDLDPSQPGYRHVIVRPNIGGGLSWARGSLCSPYGLIKSEWKVEGQMLRLAVTIPANSAATIVVPSIQPNAVTEGNRAIEQADGLKVVGKNVRSVTLSAAAGHYEFRSAVE
jgi:alpha-L-rhamnosidase